MFTVSKSKTFVAQEILKSLTSFSENLDSPFAFFMLATMFTASFSDGLVIPLFGLVTPFLEDTKTSWIGSFKFAKGLLLLCLTGLNLGKPTLMPPIFMTIPLIHYYYINTFTQYLLLFTM